MSNCVIGFIAFSILGSLEGLKIVSQSPVYLRLSWWTDGRYTLQSRGLDVVVLENTTVTRRGADKQAQLVTRILNCVCQLAASI